MNYVLCIRYCFELFDNSHDVVVIVIIIDGGSASDGRTLKNEFRMGIRMSMKLFQFDVSYKNCFHQDFPFECQQKKTPSLDDSIRSNIRFSIYCIF